MKFVFKSPTFQASQFQAQYASFNQPRTEALSSQILHTTLCHQHLNCGSPGRTSWESFIPVHHLGIYFYFKCFIKGVKVFFFLLSFFTACLPPSPQSGCWLLPFLSMSIYLFIYYISVLRCPVPKSRSFVWHHEKFSACSVASSA